MGLDNMAILTPNTLGMLIVAVECYDRLRNIPNHKNDVLQELYRLKKQMSIV
jgi:hypothetical protein